jgi:hypothetical protein
MDFRFDSYEDVCARCREQRLRAEAMRSAAGRSRAMADSMLKGANAMMATALRAHASAARDLTPSCEDRASREARSPGG